MVYIYIRQNESWDEYQCYKIDITKNIINDEKFMLSNEFIRGKYLKIYKINNVNLNMISELIKTKIQKYNFKGVWYFSKHYNDIVKIINNISNIQELSTEECENIQEIAYNDYRKNGIN
jgi:hypothetical protein